MIDKVVVFTGSKKDFEIFLEEQIPEDSETIPFMELIQHYNARLRPNESGVRENALRDNIEVDNCVVRADDYGSVMPHVLSNFANIVNLNYDMGTLYIQNPPRRVLESLKAGLDGDIEYYGSQYPELDRDALTKIYKALNSDVYGQDECKKQILSGMYRLTTGATNKPVVLMLYGPSGVGKTEVGRILQREMYPDEPPIKINFGNYSGKGSLWSLIGSPKGYVGSEQGGCPLLLLPAADAGGNARDGISEEPEPER